MAGKSESHMGRRDGGSMQGQYADPMQGHIAVDVAKLSQGLRMTFQGVAMVFDSFGAEIDIFGALVDDSAKPAPVVERAEENGTVPEGKNAKDAALSESSVDPAAGIEARIEAVNVGENGTGSSGSSGTCDTAAVAEGTPDDQKTASGITKDDITKVIVAKIKQNRSNNVKIGKLLSSYGVAKVADLPEEQFEAFLTDLSQI